MFMDVEKTIEFLLANQASHAERITRLEEAQAQLATTMNLLADRQVHLDESLDRFMELTTEGFKQTDKRISDLVSVIASLNNRIPLQ